MDRFRVFDSRRDYLQMGDRLYKRVFPCDNNKSSVYILCTPKSKGLNNIVYGQLYCYNLLDNGIVVSRHPVKDTWRMCVNWMAFPGQVFFHSLHWSRTTAIVSITARRIQRWYRQLKAIIGCFRKGLLAHQTRQQHLNLELEHLPKVGVCYLDALHSWNERI